MKKQVFNPYLPLNVCIPDGEPHVFGDRIYVYGSHDREGGTDFCLLDYEIWSAPVEDLSDWRCPGVAYRANQDPDWNPKRGYALYAPDCVQGKDGRFYLYYALAGGDLFTGPIHVAVCEKPDGPFTYYGSVRNPDGTPLTTYVTFDPAVINDDGVIRLYYGWALAVDPSQLPSDGVTKDQMKQLSMMLFGKTAKEMDATPEGVMGANTVELMDDMLTVKRRPVRIVPGQLDAADTSFAGHAFFEGSSIRKIGSTYYFIYSSEHQHELCYATSLYPDTDFRYGGVIISNGDISFAGRKTEDRVMMTGNNHGSIVKIDSQWYIFYHRQTHRNTFSRQGCAEKITILPDGSIPQVEITSCGLNEGPLRAEGTYPASICSHLSNGRMPHAGREDSPELVPAIMHEGKEHFIASVSDGTVIGYKHFMFEGSHALKIQVRGSAGGIMKVFAGDTQQDQSIIPTDFCWHEVSFSLKATGSLPLYFCYEGPGSIDIKNFSFQ